MNESKADLILRSGRVWRGVGDGFTEAVAVSRGRVMAAGNDGDIDGLVGPETRVIDLRGRLAIPGINDAHMHLLPLGLAQREVDVRPGRAATVPALLEQVRLGVASHAPGEWVYGRGYDHYLMAEKRHPLREELDLVAPDNPVYIKRCCGHMGVANSAALICAGITEATPQPDGGHRELQNGRLTGLLQERAQDAIFAAMPPPDLEELVQGIEDGGNLLLAKGITSAMDAGVGMRAGFDDYLAYVRARDTGRLPVRAYLCLLGGPNGIVEQAYEAGLITGVGDNRMKIGPVKIFTDGSAGGRTAAMREPYLGDDDEHGIFCFSDGEVEAMVLDCHAKGYQLAIHAIGDAAIDQTIAAVRIALATVPAKDRRHRIEHCGFIHPEQIAEMKRLGMICAPQPIFMRQFGDAYVELLGEARAGSAYPMASWGRAGLHPAASTDSPVSDYDPFANLHAGVTRLTTGGLVIGPDERVSVEEMLGAMTWNGAYSSFDETERGRLDDGMLADIAVLSKDLFTVDPEEFLETEADLTILGGAVVHDRMGEAAG